MAPQEGGGKMAPKEGGGGGGGKKKRRRGGAGKGAGEAGAGAGAGSGVVVTRGSVNHGDGKANRGLVRDYCDQDLCAQLDKEVEALLCKLIEFQRRAIERDPVKAKAKKRVSSGLREVLRSVRTQEARLVIVAPNIEAGPSEGGLDDKAPPPPPRGRAAPRWLWLLWSGAVLCPPSLLLPLPMSLLYTPAVDNS